MTNTEEILNNLGWTKKAADESREVWTNKRKGDIVLYKNGYDTI